MDILNLLEPITYENLHELHPGEWIWDDEKGPQRSKEHSAVDKNFY